MRESVQHCRSTCLYSFLENFTDCVTVVKQVEGDPVQGYKHVVSQFYASKYQMEIEFP